VYEAGQSRGVHGRCRWPAGPQVRPRRRDSHDSATVGQQRLSRLLKYSHAPLLHLFFVLVHRGYQ
jgi:hypothetical protein